MILATLHFLGIVWITSTFKRWDKKTRIARVGFMAFVSSSILLIGLQLNSSVNVPLTFEVTFIVIQTLSAVLICYALERMKEVQLLSQRLMKAEKLDIVNQLASSIAHEIRNPLTVIQGFLTVLSKRNIGEENKQFIKLSLDEATRANDIIKDYLTFSKSAPEKKEPLNIDHEVMKCKDIITPLANMNSVLVKTKLEENLWILGEKQLFQQCVVNVMKNCIEAMPNGGIMQVTLKRHSQKVKIEITDTGEGMTDEQLVRLGEPYFTTKGREGTGLGLLSAIQIIESLEGTFKAKSVESEGTTFYLEFPLHTLEKTSVKAI